MKEWFSKFSSNRLNTSSNTELQSNQRCLFHENEPPDCSLCKFDELIRKASDWSGYTREKAIKKLDKLGNPKAIPALLTRVNDWVPQVRMAARKALTNYLLSEYIDDWIDNLPRIYHLKQCTRHDHSEFIQDLEMYLQRAELSTYLVAGVNHCNRLVSRISLELCVQLQLLSPTQLVERFLTHEDMIIRSKIVSFIKVLDVDIQKRALEVALRDRVMPIRREAFQIALTDSSEDKWACQFLFDSHSTIRELAIEYLKSSDVNLSAIYENALDSSKPSQLVCALWGVAFFKSYAALERVKKLMGHSSPKVRREAMNTLSLLEPEGNRTLFLQALNDSRRSVCKQAARLASKARIAYQASELLDVLNQSNRGETLEACMLLIKSINKWERFLFLVHLISGIERFEREIQWIKDKLLQWDFHFNQSSIHPTMEQVQQIRTLIESLDFLEKWELGSLRFTLSSYGVLP